MKKNKLGILACGLLVAAGSMVGCNKDKEEEKKPECATKYDCKGGFNCVDGFCVAAACDPNNADSCAAGSFCNDMGECVSYSSVAKSCDILGVNGQAGSGLVMAAGNKVSLEAIALQENGAPIFGAKFNFKAGSKDIADGEYVAAADDTKITATLDGTDISCSIDVKVIAAADESKIRVMVYDDTTGKVVAGAKIYLDAASESVGETNADGILELNSVNSQTYSITAFKEGYNYVTFANISAKDIVIPLGPHPAGKGTVSGKLDFSEYAKFLGGKDLDLKAGYVLSSLPLSNLFSMDIEHFVAQWKDMAIDLDALGFGGVKNALGDVDIPESVELPTGLVAGSLKGWLNESFVAGSYAGKRIPWALGLELSITDIMGFVGMAMDIVGGKGINVANIFTSVLPILSKLSVAVGTPVDGANGAKQDLSLNGKVSEVARITINSLPEGADAVGLVHVNNATGYGAVVNGIGLGADIDGDGKIDASTICKGKDCPVSFENGNIEAGKVGMLYAAPQGALTGSEKMTIVATAPVGRKLMNAEMISAKEYGAIRFFVDILRGDDSAFGTVSASDFIGLPGGVTLDSFMASYKDHKYNFTQASGAEMNVMVFAVGDDIDVPETRWMVYSANGGEIKLPTPPEGMLDVFNCGYYPLVAHLSVALKKNVNFADLINNNGANIDRVIENTTKASVLIPYYGQELNVR